MVAGRGRDRARPPADRIGDLQPAGTRDATADRRDHALRDRQLRQAADGLPAELVLALQHPDPQGPAADADRQPRDGVDPGRGAPGALELPVLRGQAVWQRRARLRLVLRAVPGRGARYQNARTSRGGRSPDIAELAPRSCDRRRLGVLGWPVAHSRSPAMHNAALAAVGLERWRYQLLPVAPALLHETVPALRRAGFRGANVTIPHKQAALAIAVRPDRPRSGDRSGQHARVRRRRVDRGRQHRRPALIASLPVAVVGSTRAGARRGRQRPGRGVGAAGRRRRRGVGLEPHARSAPVPCARTSAGRPSRARATADVLVNCTSIGLKEPERTFAELPVEAGDLGGYRCVVDFVYAPVRAV